MSDFAIFNRPLDSDTPVSVLSGIDLSGYDRVIAEFKKRKAEKDEAQARALTSAKELCVSLGKLLETFPKIEAAGISDEFSRLDAAETLLSDGIVPANAEALHSEFAGYLNRLSDIQKNVNRAIKIICPPLQTIDAKLSTTLRSRLGALEHIVKRLVTHYRHMDERTKNIVQRSKTVPDATSRTLATHSEVRARLRALNPTNASAEIKESKRVMERLFNLRCIADYNLKLPFTAEDAEDAVELAKGVFANAKATVTVASKSSPILKKEEAVPATVPEPAATSPIDQSPKA